MILQKVLLKLVDVDLVPARGRRVLQNRAWTVEDGPAAGLRMALPQNRDYLRGDSELPVQRLISEILAPGDVFYDIGANVGFFSILAARRVGADGAVYAFEPVPANAAAIRRNAALNDFPNVSLLEVAVDEHSGVADLYMTSWDGGASLSAQAIPASQPVDQKSVPVKSIDDLSERGLLRPPNVVKIDVEGLEARVIKGMVRTIAWSRPTLVYEIDDGDAVQFENRWRALDELVASLGYAVTRLKSSYPNLKWHVGHSVAVPASPRHH
jgi:FkbM family methyltransferase